MLGEGPSVAAAAVVGLAAVTLGRAACPAVVAGTYVDAWVVGGAGTAVGGIASRPYSGVVAINICHIRLNVMAGDRLEGFSSLL